MQIVVPGKPGGPCGGNCNHLACQQLRVIAETKCSICFQPIGYNKPCISYEQRCFHEKCLYESSYSQNAVSNT